MIMSVAAAALPSTTEDEVREGRRIDDDSSSFLVINTGDDDELLEEEVEAADDGKESEAEELTYVERIGSKYCPLADGRNMFQNSCHRFVICSNGQLSQFGQCPVGQIFDPVIANCIEIGRAQRRDCSSQKD